MRVGPAIAAVALALASLADAQQLPSTIQAVPVFSAQSATATATSTAVNTAAFQNYSITITYSGITGSPAGCQLQPLKSDDTSNFFNYGAAIPILPSASTTSQQIPANGHPGPFGKQMEWKYTCQTTPSAGTFSLTVLYVASDASNVEVMDSAITQVFSGAGTAGPLLMNGKHGASLTVSVLSGSGSTIIITPKVRDASNGTNTDTAVLVRQVGSGATAISSISAAGEYTFEELGGAQEILASVSIIGGSDVLQITLRATEAPSFFLPAAGVHATSGVPANQAQVMLPGQYTTAFSSVTATATHTSSADSIGAWAGYQISITWGTITGTYTGCTIQPQILVDGTNAKNYGVPIPVTPSTGAVENHPIQTTGIQGRLLQYVYNCSAFGSGGTFTATTFYAVLPNVQPVTLEYGQRASYHASSAKTTLVTGATDFCFIEGSSTKTVRVLEIIFTGTATTATEVPLSVILRSAANSGGSCTSGTSNDVPSDQTADPAGTADPFFCTTNPTSLGSSLGTVDSRRYFLSTATTSPSVPPLEFKFGTLPGEQPIILRGTAQTLALNGNGTAITGGAYECTIIWTEDIQ